MKFSIKQMFLSITAATISGYAGLFMWTAFNGNYDEISRRLHAHPRIFDVKIWTIGEGPADLATDVLGIEFKIIGQPQSCIAISTPKSDLFIHAAAIPLDRIGDISLAVCYIVDGEAKAWGSVDVGPNSDLQSALPFTVKNLDQLVDNYDAKLAAFRKWPTRVKPGVIKISPTLTIEYWASPLRP